MEGQKSYGGSYSGSGFDFVEFMKKPLTICRLISILFAIIVFGCISAKGYDPFYHHCIFNGNQDACHYGVAIGVLAFLACLLFIAVDAQFDNISNTVNRKHLVMADLAFSILWSFLWFVCFCFLADEWRKTKVVLPQAIVNNARGAVAFSFFSIFTWVALSLMAYQRYRQGDGLEEYNAPENYTGGYSDPSDTKQSPYASFPQPAGEVAPPSYQQQPFAVPDQPFGVPPQQPVKTDYNVPEY